MENKICCLFEEKNAKKAMKERDFELVNWLINSYRHDRVLYRCKKCGGLILYDYEETAHFLPGEDWDNAYIEEYYWPVLPEDIRTVDEEIEFDWSAITVRKHIFAEYRELDEGEKPYYYVDAKEPVTRVERMEYSKECPATVAFDILPADKQAFDDMCIFIQIPEFPIPRDLILQMPNHDDPQEIKVSFKDGTYSMELCFPMDGFGWNHPMVLASEDLEYKDVKAILTEICLNQTETGDIPLIVERFKDVTAIVFPEDKE